MQDDRTDRLDKAIKQNKTYIAFIVANANPEYKIPMSTNTKKKSGGKALGFKHSQTEVTYTDRRQVETSGEQDIKTIPKALKAQKISDHQKKTQELV